jgi:hypothetical protein
VGLVTKFQIPRGGLLGSLQQLHNLDLIVRTKKATVSRKQYEKFCREFVFDALRGDTFGKAFCHKFKIMDYILLLSTDMDEAMRYIEKSKYIKDKETK